MPTSGPHNATVFSSDDDNGGVIAWDTPANAATSNNTYTTASSGGDNVISEYHKSLSPDFSDVPDDAMVSAIIVTLERSNASNANIDVEAKLVVSGTVQDDNQAKPTFWPGADAVATYTFEVALRGAQIKTDFGFVISTLVMQFGIARIDHITFSATYTEADDATGELSHAVANLRQSLANGSNFQTLVSAEDADEALESIYITALPKPESGGKHKLSELQEYRPYALIFFDEEAGVTFERDAHDSAGTRRGMMHVELVRDVPESLADDPAEAEMSWLRTIDSIINDLIDQLDPNTGTLNFSRLTTEGPMRSHPDVEPTMGDFQAMRLHFEYFGGASE